jgi:prenyltransferase beta subunit
MSYAESIEKAARWLASIQSDSGGWGLNPQQGTSIVNTAEAAYVLFIADRNRHHDAVKKAVRFVERNCASQLQNNPRTRYAAFGLMLAQHVPELCTGETAQTSQWLFDARNSDGGWGHSAKDQRSMLYPTVMALQVLRRFGADRLDASYNWVKARNVQGRWSFAENQGASVVATAMAICALKDFDDLTKGVYASGRDDLVSFSNWGVVGEDQPGTNWMHNSWMWVIPALVAFGVAPYEKTVAEGVRQLNNLQCEHGWREPEPLGHLTVRGQYWATATFQSIREAFDPSVHPYRIDSAIAVQQMKEPEFVIIKPNKKFSLAIHSGLYRVITGACIIFAALFFTGLHRTMLGASRKVDFGIAVVLFATGAFLVQKRRKQFRTIHYIFAAIVTIASLLHLLLGYSVWEVFEHLNMLFRHDSHL